jgi:hypothetical protein
MDDFAELVTTKDGVRVQPSVGLMTRLLNEHAVGAGVLVGCGMDTGTQQFSVEAQSELAT